MEMSLIHIARPSPCLVNKQFLFPNKRRERTISVKALKSSYPKRATLSSNWDVSDLSAVTPAAAPSWFPRFEDLDTTNMLLRQRIIFLGSQVDDMTADLIISQLLLLDAEDSEKDIKLFINSPGGSVTAVQKINVLELLDQLQERIHTGLGIYDAMKMCKADVSTICLGLAASMGAFLLAAGTKGKRFCMPNSRVLIHQPIGSFGGTIEKDTERDTFMNPWEAKEYGLVDGVIDDGKPGLVAPTADAIPPPKTEVWYLWKIAESGNYTNLPSEHKLLESGNTGDQGSDGGTDAEQEKREPAP
ncbi:ATP-dependent Clp protease proteolytic subunit 3, chloroplastic-like isoform X3 [Durio zibethinus]|uniref:ATP-dependent Clp protease proteolytic subunit n=1 Tax=Durio zibethinus TaxID=66656 RepID=A0A6P6A3I7_DURZI|nr:ATP-dependent Clp protease proteolytic subunit 3, chloroplastic-like isoform X3 [Durio zibethinus]